MNARDDLISIITEQLGSAATRKDGELVFDYLHGRDLITWDDREGYVMAEEVNTIRAYEQAIEQTGSTSDGSIEIGDFTE